MAQTCLASPLPATPVRRAGHDSGRAADDSGQAAESTAALVERAREGSHEAFAVLHHRYHRVVESVVRAETRHEADVADLVQEAFTRAWIRLGSLKHPERFRAWLLQIARHGVIDHGRTLGRRPTATGTGGEPAFDLMAAVGPGPAEIVEAADLADRLRLAIDGLSRRDAVAVTLAAQFGLGPADIGAALGISPNNAKVVLHRARHRLRHAVED